MVFGTSIFYLQLNNGFSGQQPIESYVYAMYNVTMTTLAVGFFMLLTQDVSHCQEES